MITNTLHHGTKCDCCSPALGPCAALPPSPPHPPVVIPRGPDFDTVSPCPQCGNDLVTIGGNDEIVLSDYFADGGGASFPLTLTSTYSATKLAIAYPASMDAYHVGLSLSADFCQDDSVPTPGDDDYEIVLLGPSNGPLVLTLTPPESLRVTTFGAQIGTDAYGSHEGRIQVWDDDGNYYDSDDEPTPPVWATMPFSGTCDLFQGAIGGSIFGEPFPLAGVRKVQFEYTDPDAKGVMFSNFALCLQPDGRKSLTLDNGKALLLDDGNTLAVRM